MTKCRAAIRDVLATAGLTGMAYALSCRFFNLGIGEHISTVFVFAVFLISLLTSFFVYGVVASFAAVYLINWAFTAPYYELDFITASNLISGIVMLLISILTSIIVSSNKKHEKREMENAKDRVRANLLRAVSHDLRTPLTTISSASSMLIEDEGLTGERKKEMLGKIRDDSEWLTRMVENLLTITRIDNTEMHLEMTPTIIDALADSAVRKFHSRHPDEKLTVTLPDEIVTVRMDAILIEQVLMNLLENAVVHAEGHTEILLTVKTADDNTIFIVEDDGCGIAESKMKTLFSGYGEREREKKSRFSGIGLMVSATIIHAHSGKIEAANRKPHGARFSFTLKTEKNND